MTIPDLLQDLLDNHGGLSDDLREDIIEIQNAFDAFLDDIERSDYADYQEALEDLG